MAYIEGVPYSSLSSYEQAQYNRELALHWAQKDYKEQGLKALFEKPILYPIPENWDGPYIDREVQKDPWGNEFEYSDTTTNGLPFSIVSYGADGKSGGEGNNEDICSWK